MYNIAKASEQDRRVLFIICKYAAAFCLTGQTSDTKLNVLSLQGNVFYLVSGLFCSLFTFLCKNVGITAATKACRNNKYFLRHLNLPRFPLRTAASCQME